MSIRSAPFGGSGKLTRDGVRKLNALANQLDISGGNNTSPMIRTPAGVIAQYRRHLAYRDGFGTKYHFQVEQYTATKVLIHAGRILIEGTALLLTKDGGGTSGLYDDVKTLTIENSGWICGDLGSSISFPTTLTCSNHSSYPSSSGDKSWPFAYVTFADGAITDLEPVWTGGDFSWPIRGIRFDSSTGWLQISYCLNPSGSDWINKIEFVGC
jgi:hypothetical protein